MRVLDDHADRRGRIELGMFGLLRDESAAAEAHQHYVMQALAARSAAIANSVDSTTRMYNQVSLLNGNPGEEAHHCQAMTCHGRLSDCSADIAWRLGRTRHLLLLSDIHVIK